MPRLKQNPACAGFLFFGPWIKAIELPDKFQVIKKACIAGFFIAIWWAV